MMLFKVTVCFIWSHVATTSRKISDDVEHEPKYHDILLYLYYLMYEYLCTADDSAALVVV